MSGFIRWTLILQVVLGTFLSAWAQLPNCPLRPNPGSVVQDPPSLSSRNGNLSLGLTLRNAVDASGYTHYCFDYQTSQGRIEAPTLRVNRGDTLVIDMTNQLNVTVPASALVKYPMSHRRAAVVEPPTDPCKSQIMDFNTTNLHFHGLNVPPVCHQDDVINTLIQPGPTPFRYQIEIPANEPPGLYWYHPHPHGYTALQVNGGAAGAIIVNGIEKVKPQVAGLTERVFVIRQQFLNPLAWIPGTYQLTLNFQPATAPVNPSPVILLRPNEKQFWRVANASTQAFLSLSILFGSGAQPLEIVALDGVPVNGEPVVKSINVPPAGRAEFIVTGPPSGASATFVDNGFDTGPVGNPNARQVLADIVTTATPLPQVAVEAGEQATLPTVTPRFSGLGAMKATTTRKLYFSEAALGTNPPVNFFITVDGQQPRVFSKDQPPAIVTKVGAVEDWVIENRTSEEHAFHMHQLHFLVMAVNGVSLANPTLQDTYSVPFWSGSGPYPSITVRMDFRDPNIAGTFVYHCHILDHEDAGMMAKIRVDP